MSLSIRPAQAAALLALAACAGAPSGAPPVPAGGAAWTAEVNPFPVTDSAGRQLELAFLGGFNTPRPQLVDLDGDGDLDLAVQEYTGRLMALLRDGVTPDGLPRFVHAANRWAGLDIGEWSRFVDLDADGRPDLFAELPYSYLRFWRNGGTAARPAFTAAPDSLRDTDGTAIFSDRQNIPQLVDIDCNGRLDLLIGRITGIILHYELVSAPSEPPVFRLVTDRFQDLEILTGQGSMHGANTMAFADVDGDGDQDLVWGDFFEAGLLLFENTGSCARPALRKEHIRFPAADPLLTSGYNAPAFGDLDGDGRLDFVAGVLGGAYDPNRTTVANLHYYASGARAGQYVARTSQLLPMVDVGSESIPVLVDLDGDGDLDLLVANKIDPSDRKTGKVYRFDNVGSRRAPAFRMAGTFPMAGAYHLAPAVGDLDGDGDPDFLVGSFGARLAFWRNDGGRWLMADSALVTITRGSNTTPALGDLDGDGDLDLLIGENSGGLNYYRNDGTPQAPAFVLVSDVWEGIDVGRRSAPALADLDGDGDLDLLIGSDDQGLVLYRNQGTRAVPKFVLEPAFRLDVPPITAPVLGDLDGDGRLELVVGNTGGGLLYFRPGVR